MGLKLGLYDNSELFSEILLNGNFLFCYSVLVDGGCGFIGDITLHEEKTVCFTYAFYDNKYNIRIKGYHCNEGISSNVDILEHFFVSLSLFADLVCPLDYVTVM